MQPFADQLTRMARQEPGACDDFVASWHAFLMLHGF